MDENGHELGGDDALAAEYVLGVLSGDERREVSLRIERDRAFAALVDAWEVRLAALSDAYAPVEPPASLKAAIDRRLATSAAPVTAAASPGLFSSLAFWRGLAVAAFAALAVAVVAPRLAPPVETPASPRLVASLAAEDSDVRYVALYDAAGGAIDMSHLAGERGEGRDFELWVIEGDAPPTSLGVVPAGEHVHIPLGEDLRAKIARGAVVAISLEPAGGSPSGAPTGPVVAAGELRGI